jgi:NADPH-ferrihemoprotein reductase
LIDRTCGSNPLVPLLAFAALLYLITHYWFRQAPEDLEENLKRGGGFKSSGGSRDIVERMKSTGTNFVVFFGSQTGTAQDNASKLAMEGHSRFGLKTLVADIEDYDYENMVDFPSESVAVFVWATFGEGEPTDNAVDFYEFITDLNPPFASDKEVPL